MLSTSVHSLISRFSAGDKLFVSYAHLRETKGEEQRPSIDCVVNTYIIFHLFPSFLQ